MTCIVGIKKNGQVLLASDSLTVYQNVKLVNVSNDYKIYTFNNFSIAISGEGPVSEILESIQDSRMWEEANLHGRAD